MGRADLIEDIIDRLIDLDYLTLAHETYLGQRADCAREIAKALDDFILIQGKVVE